MGNERPILPVPSREETKAAIMTLAAACHHRAWNAGWWHDLETGEAVQRPVPEIISLLHSEISEGFEGWRKGKMDNHLPQYPMLLVEMVDEGVRVFDFAGGGIPGPDGILASIETFAEAFCDKLEYNDNRADHKPENRKAAGGKKI